ncbi:hypothetical protein [Pseudoduganella violaceinigra]|uniref:hypothetical protein n=1 Tax=Pseudoduganella violaceinigra TaxID=246602 RepID=UPI0012B61D80|nr:hypothetical protein [Pseudoduganella violaceinigra]
MLMLLALTSWRAFAADTGCPAKDGLEAWSPSCFTVKGNVRSLKPQYLRKLKFKKSGKAVLLIEDPREVLALDRRGRVVVPGIYHTGDFDYPSARRGVGRFAENGRCGYFQSGSFKILVPAEYDQCQTFFQNGALSCKECLRYCTKMDCQDSRLVGGQGFWFDARGRLLKSFSLPVLDQVCSHGIEKLIEEGQYRFLRCKLGPNDPFQM